MQNRIALQPAYILHRRPYRDSSFLVDIVTPDHGRVGLVAKGYRQNKKQGHLLQPFTECLVSWQGQHELKTLTAIEANTRANFLVGRQLYSALYVNEILMRLLPKYDPHPDLYRAYHDLLQAFTGGDEIEILLRQFELQMLAELGYGIDLTSDAEHHQPIAAQTWYRYIPDCGFFIYLGEEKSNLTVFAGEDIQAIAANDYREANTLRAAKRLLRQAMAPHLGEKPLASRQLFARSHVKPE